MLVAELYDTSTENVRRVSICIFVGERNGKYEDTENASGKRKIMYASEWNLLFLIYRRAVPNSKVERK